MDGRAVGAILAVVGAIAIGGCGGNSRGVVVPRRVPERDPVVIGHVLNRLGFGARPGDLQRVAAMGVRAYVEQQLHPGTLADGQLADRLAGFRTLHDSGVQFAHEYYPGVIQARKELAAQAASASALARGSSASVSPLAPGRGGVVLVVPVMVRGRTLPIAAASLEGQSPMRVLTQGTVTPEELRMQRHNQLTLAEMQQAKILRAVYSDRQLEEVLTDFWMNHFNVFAGKVEDFVLVSEMERETVRPYVFGRFRDMLGAVARSPAMLVFLDNYLNGAPVGKPPKIGLNENYARELMELHTLGVDGGYTQADVKEVARCFTGWTVRKIHEEPTFVFDPKRHDRGAKLVLGHKIPANGGVEEGEAVLDILARHPSTARFIATKLARRFVSDTPPQALVQRAAKTFRQTDGDLRAVVQTIITSPEFFSPAAMHAKIKSPFEFIVSALRATNANIVDPAPLVGTIAQLGEPLYFCLPPTGYPDRADAWINTGGLFSRMNIATSLAANKLGGVKIDVASIDKGLTPDASQSLAITLGSPDFQRR